MVSDRYILQPGLQDMDKILDIAEHMAACYGFDSKELMRIRLLTEEMILSLRSGIALTPGALWFHTGDGMFIITASVGTDVSSMSSEHRKKLLETFKPPKKTGLFGVIQSFMEYMAVAESSVNLYGYAEMHYGGYAGSYYEPIETWNMERLARLATPSKPVSEEDEAEEEWETSLLKGFANDITVTSKAGMFEMSVMKKIPDASLAVISGKSK